MDYPGDGPLSERAAPQPLMHHLRTRLFLLSIVSHLLLGTSAVAQDAAGTGATPFAEGELEQLVAPIALYPDDVVSQILMAATYPLEIVEADRWVKSQKPPLKGDELARALKEKTWDPSVKSLVEFPDVLEQMSTKLDWTQKLGDAMLEQEEEVMSAAQRLRKRALESGNLESSEQQTVTRDGDVVIIQPANPEVVYIPTYNPTVVYGTWPYPAYPPTYYYPPYYRYPSSGWAFATGVAVGVAWGYAWGGCGWHHGHVDINVNKNINLNRNIDRNRYKAQIGGNGKGNWKHNPENRRGVRYRDGKTAQRYGQSGRDRTRTSREAYRGRSATNRSTRTGGGLEASSPRNRASTSRTGSLRSSSHSRSSNSAFRNYNNRSSTSRYSSRGHASRGGMHGGGGFRGGRRR